MDAIAWYLSIQISGQSMSPALNPAGERSPDYTINQVFPSIARGDIVTAMYGD